MTGEPEAGGDHHLVIVDAANCLYRAFFALPPLRTATGFPTNAALGFVNMLAKAVREEGPDQLVIVFDPPDGKSFRQELYSEYKAQRDKQPEDLSAQIPAVRELIDAYRMAVLEVEGFEADDVIATLVARAPENTRITVLSTDKDLMQLVSERVTLLDTMKDRRYDPAAVEERFGVPPAQVLDLRALVGDPSDNIPGVRGIGEKGAAKLIREWGNLEALLAGAETVKPSRASSALREQREAALLSKRLATLRDDVELPLRLDELTLEAPDTERLRVLFQRFEFTRLLAELEPATVPAPDAKPVDAQVLEGVEDLARWLEGGAGERLTLFPVGAGASAVREPPVGLAVAGASGSVAYLPCRGDEGEALARVLDPAVAPGLWGGTATKEFQIWYGEQGGVGPAPVFDVEIAGFLLDPGASRGLPALASQYLGRTLRSWEALAGRGAKAVPAAELPRDELARWATEQCHAVRELVPRLESRLEEVQSRDLYRDVELPLTAVLARMERAGVRVDEGGLRALSREYEGELAAIEAEIHRLAGESFAVNSPKQLQTILFEKLKLPVLRKTKTGYSTDEGVLEQLSSQHPLPERVLAYRRLAKLKSTYVDALPPLVYSETGRIHPVFHQTGAATGRLSASNPNVQNIPIRTEQGLRIREAFIPDADRVLVSADYSQVELRILAHLSEDAQLLEAFRAGEDIHRRTAAGVAGIATEAVTDEQRARAKAINFGIIYGSTAFGIANQLGIASAEAQQTIDAYFARYQGVRRFLDETVAVAKQQGFVTTLLGRRRYLPDLASRNRVLQNAAERMAVNTVIQGTAADLIKRAMVRVDAALREEAWEAQMILQVHDELVFEVAPEHAGALEARVRAEMQGAAELRVPLLVDVGRGSNWREAH